MTKITDINDWREKKLNAAQLGKAFADVEWFYTCADAATGNKAIEYRNMDAALEVDVDALEVVRSQNIRRAAAINRTLAEVTPMFREILRETLTPRRYNVALRAALSHRDDRAPLVWIGVRCRAAREAYNEAKPKGATTLPKASFQAILEYLEDQAMRSNRKVFDPIRKEATLVLEAAVADFAEAGGY